MYSSSSICLHLTLKILLQAHKGTEVVSETSNLNDYSEEPLLPSFLPSASHSFSAKIGKNILPAVITAMIVVFCCSLSIIHVVKKCT